MRFMRMLSVEGRNAFRQLCQFHRVLGMSLPHEVSNPLPD
jgi:hypothetical protein